jgi:chromosome segregation ATPase
MSTDDRILRLENAMSTLAEMAAEQQRLSAEQQRRVSRLDEPLVALIELSRSHNEGMDELRAGQVELRAAQIESEQKIAALVDAHIRTEDALARLAETVNDILRNGRDGQSPS